MRWLTKKNFSKTPFPEENNIYAYTANGDKIIADGVEKNGKKITCMGTLTFEQSTREIEVYSSFYHEPNAKPDYTYDGYILMAVYNLKVNIEGINRTFTINNKTELSVFDNTDALYKVVGETVEEGVSGHMKNEIERAVIENLADEIDKDKVNKGKEFMNSFESLDLTFDFDTNSNQFKHKIINDYEEKH